ncbi:MAG: nuclease-like protein [Firmicutes bacterium]|nr:nuclease-like protein [Bacillota bacterium]
MGAVLLRRVTVGLAVLLVAVVAAPLPSHAGSASLPATVVRVVDGDTLVVWADGREETVRLIGVDTPETVHPTIGAQPGGPEASAFTRRLLPPGTRVTLELDVQQRDRYGRMLAYVYLPDGRMLNAELLRTGLAQLMTIPPKVGYVDLFVRLQREAREAGRGLWGEVAPAPATAGGGGLIVSVDLAGEEVVLVNDGDGPVDLSGWALISVAGNQRFTFPVGTVLEPGARLVVRSGPSASPGPGVLIWTSAHVWNNQGDPAELRDPSGQLIARYP